MRPTPAALELLPVITSSLVAIDDAVRSRRPATADRLVTLAPNRYVEFVLMAKLVASLRSAAPGIRLRLVPFGTDLG